MPALALIIIAALCAAFIADRAVVLFRRPLHQANQDLERQGAAAGNSAIIIVVILFIIGFAAGVTIAAGILETLKGDTGKLKHAAVAAAFIAGAVQRMARETKPPKDPTR